MIIFAVSIFVMDVKNDSEVQSLFLTAKFFYYAMHLLVLLILGIYDNSLRLQIINGEFWQALCLCVCMLLEFYFYHVCSEISRNRSGHSRHSEAGNRFPSRVVRGKSDQAKPTTELRVLCYSNR